MKLWTVLLDGVFNDEVRADNAEAAIDTAMSKYAGYANDPLRMHLFERFRYNARPY